MKFYLGVKTLNLHSAYNFFLYKTDRWPNGWAPFLGKGIRSSNLHYLNIKINKNIYIFRCYSIKVMQCTVNAPYESSILSNT